MTDNISGRGLTSTGAAVAENLLQPPGNAPGVGFVDWEDTSFRVLARGATRNTTTKKLADSDLLTKITLADSDNWQVVEYDPEAGLIVIVPDAAILITTDPAANKASEGFPIAANAAFPLRVAGSPIGRFFVRRAAAGQPNINGYGFGSRKMAFASRRQFDVAPTNA